MQDKIKARLKEKFSGVNLSQARIDAIADKLSSKITEESDIDARLDELNDLHPFAEIAKYDDWQRTKAQKKPDNPKPQPQNPPADPQDEPDLKTMFQDLKKELDSLRKEKRTESLQKKLADKIAEKKIPAILLKGRSVESEDQLETVLAEIEADHNAYKQDLINQGFSQTSAPAGGSGGKLTEKQIDAEIAAWAGKDKK